MCMHAWEQQRLVLPRSPAANSSRTSYAALAISTVRSTLNCTHSEYPSTNHSVFPPCLERLAEAVRDVPHSSLDSRAEWYAKDTWATSGQCKHVCLGSVIVMNGKCCHHMRLSLNSKLRGYRGYGETNLNSTQLPNIERGSSIMLRNCSQSPSTDDWKVILGIAHSSSTRRSHGQEPGLPKDQAYLFKHTHRLRLHQWQLRCLCRGLQSECNRNQLL